MNAFTHTLSVAGLLLVTLTWNTRAQAAPLPSRWATLEAIHQLENPRNLTTPGRYGELGPYQFRESTWKMHTSVPFAHALDRQASDEVAVKHYEWIRRRLEAAGLPVTAYNIALAWNGGIDGVVLGRAPAVAHDYAERAANLAAVLSARVVASVR